MCGMRMLQVLEALVHMRLRGGGGGYGERGGDGMALGEQLGDGADAEDGAGAAAGGATVMAEGGERWSDRPGGARLALAGGGGGVSETSGVVWVVTSEPGGEGGVRGDVAQKEKVPAVMIGFRPDRVLRPILASRSRFRGLPVECRLPRVSIRQSVQLMPVARPWFSYLDN